MPTSVCSAKITLYTSVFALLSEVYTFPSDQCSLGLNPNPLETVNLMLHRQCKASTCAPSLGWALIQDPHASISGHKKKNPTASHREHSGHRWYPEEITNYCLKWGSQLVLSSPIVLDKRVHRAYYLRMWLPSGMQHRHIEQIHATRCSQNE